jgi:predicted transcriptional regulator
MEHYGLVQLHKSADGKIAPRVSYTDIVLDVPIATRHGAAA